MKELIKKLWFCKIFNWHEWTSKSRQAPVKKISTIDDFLDYATMYCERCGKVSELSKQFNQKIKCKNSESK